MRILFRPKESSYKSSKEEDKEAAESDDAAASVPPRGKGLQTKGYLSPEAEKKLEEKLNGGAGNAVVTAGSASSPSAPKKKAPKPEGGLEVIVESKPYRRVRIKRCNMGPDTVVKEESEAILLKNLIRGIEVLETDYKLMLMRSMKNV